MKKEKAIQVSGNFVRSHVLTQSGKLYHMGDDYYIMRGCVKSLSPCLVDQKWFNNKNIIQICCGFSHTMVLTQQGNVYSWGNNHHGVISSDSFASHSIPQKKRFQR